MYYIYYFLVKKGGKKEKERKCRECRECRECRQNPKLPDNKTLHLFWESCFFDYTPYTLPTHPALPK